MSEWLTETHGRGMRLNRKTYRITEADFCSSLLIGRELKVNEKTALFNKNECTAHFLACFHWSKSRQMPLNSWLGKQFENFQAILFSNHKLWIDLVETCESRVQHERWNAKSGCGVRVRWSCKTSELFLAVVDSLAFRRWGSDRAEREVDFFL